MAEAGTFGSWLNLINRKSSADLAQGRITQLDKPALQVYSDPDTPLPGRQKTSV
jgi:hypothetical protein